MAVFDKRVHFISHSWRESQQVRSEQKTIPTQQDVIRVTKRRPTHVRIVFVLNSKTEVKKKRCTKTTSNVHVCVSLTHESPQSAAVSFFFFSCFPPFSLCCDSRCVDNILASVNDSTSKSKLNTQRTPRSNNAIMKIEIILQPELPSATVQIHSHRKA